MILAVSVQDLKFLLLYSIGPGLTDWWNEHLLCQGLHGMALGGWPSSWALFWYRFA
jgi:hypothetical protein